MINFSRRKIFTISAICLVSLYFSISIFIPKDSKISQIFPDSRLSLGLDLQGGSQLTLQLAFEEFFTEYLTKRQNEIKSALRKANIRAIPKVSREIIQIIFTNESEEKIEKFFKDYDKNIFIEKNSEGFSIVFNKKFIASLKHQLLTQSIEIVKNRVDALGTKEAIIHSQGVDRIVVQVPGLSNPKELKDIIGKTAKMTFHFVDESGSSNSSATLMNDSYGRQYLIKNKIILNGEMLTDANPTYHEGKAAVGFRFNIEGSKAFSRITRENIGRMFAVILDNQVLTAPVIQTPINDGMGVITGNFTTQEAGNLSLLLRSGSLPAPLDIVEERTVGPSLGAQSIKKGIISSIIGLFLVFILMLTIYKKFGLISTLAIIVNLSLVTSFMMLFDATLTLPGIAGIVLVIGMAVDANVLIFERIREENSRNKSNIAAIDNAFANALRSITDSNITTMIVAIFLYVFGYGAVKGFAVTLFIGITSSMFTSIMLVRMIISIWLKRSKKRGLKFFLTKKS
jgi:protein-export membrane protein SecD